jgi:proteic killer suppression protein
LITSSRITRGGSLRQGRFTARTGKWGYRRRASRWRLGVASALWLFASRHVTRYIRFVIKTFADRRTKDLYVSSKAKGIPTHIAIRAARKLEYLDLAVRLDDLRVPPGNRLHALGGDRGGQYAISVNDQWRICFRFVDGDAYDVEFCDYH